MLTPAAPAPPAAAAPEPALPPRRSRRPNGSEPVTVELSRTVPRSGNLTVAGQRFWLGPDHAGSTVTLWADATVVHLLVNGVRLKTMPSRLSTAQLRQLLADGGRPAGPPPLPSGDAGTGPAMFPAHRSSGAAGPGRV